MAFMTIMTTLLEGISSGLESSRNVRKKNDIKEAHRLASENRFEEALTILENVNPRMMNIPMNIMGYLVKAICYAELNYSISARECLQIILNMPRALNPFYMYVRSDAQKMAQQIKNEYNL